MKLLYIEAVAYEVGKLLLKRDVVVVSTTIRVNAMQHDCLMLSEQERWQSYGLEAIERMIVC
jgi:UDP-N-acetyl-D-mannosaminuronate dehydrogenase